MISHLIIKSRAAQVLSLMLALWLVLSFSQLAAAQQSHSAKRNVSRNPTVAKRSATPKSAPVRTASANRQSSTLAPAATYGASETISVLELDDQSISPNLAHENNVVHESMGCDSCGSVDTCCCTPAGYLFDWTRADLSVGTVGFVVPANFLSTAANSSGAVEGAFGFQESINFGTRLPSVLAGQLGSQIGARFIQANLDGTSAGVDSRQQAFVTAGLFRRVDYGVQAGLVVDYLHDDWLYKADLLQLRGELSYMLSPCHEIGFRFTDSQQTDTTSYRLRGSGVESNVQLTTLNTYRGYYRVRFSEQGRNLAELQVGGTEDSGTILGMMLQTPLQGQVGLTTSATYLIPSKDSLPNYASEGWSLGIAMVWTPGRCFGLNRDYYRPLFEVADNGSMISKLE